MTSSVTVCSTWIRVFISMKKYSPVPGQEPLDRPGGAVAGGARGVDRDLADPGAERVVDGRRRRLLDELLVAALDRAVPLAEVDHVAVRVGEHLDLDVARVLEVALDVDRRVREVLLALPRRRLEGTLGVVRLADELHALAAAARRGLDDQRVPDLLAERDDASAAVPTGSTAPGMIGTPAARIAARAAVFEPISSIASGGGPIHVSPASSTCARTRRSPRGSRSQGGPPRRRRAARSRRARRRAGSSPSPGPGPMRYASSAARTCARPRSASE